MCVLFDSLFWQLPFICYWRASSSMFLLSYLPFPSRGGGGGGWELDIFQNYSNLRFLRKQISYFLPYIEKQISSVCVYVCICTCKYQDIEVFDLGICATRNDPNTLDDWASSRCLGGVCWVELSGHEEVLLLSHRWRSGGSCTVCVRECSLC